MARSALSGVLCVLLGLPLGGCDIEEFFGVSKRKDPPTVMLGDLDGGGDGDLGTGDGGDGDGDDDAGTADGGLRFDDDVAPDCNATVTDEDWSDVVEFGDETSFSLTRGVVGFGLAYRPAVVGCDRIHAAEVPGTGAFPIPPAVLGEDSCNVIRDLSLVYSADAWWMAYTDNSTGDIELHAQAYDDNLLLPRGNRVRVSDNAGLTEDNPIMADLVDRPMVAWITSDGVDQQGISTRMVDGDHDEQTIVEMGSEHRPTKIAAAQMGMGAGAIAWINEQGSAVGVWIQKIDADAAPVGSPVRLSRYAGAGATVDLSTRDRGGEERLGGAVIYSVSAGGSGHEVLYRRLGPDGEPLGVERAVVGLPLRGSDASVAELSGAYVIAYRALPGGGVESPEIRVVVVSREGDLPRDEFGRPISATLASATLAQARTTLRVSVDGQMLVSWMDVGAEGDTVLKMSRKRLDCR